MTQTETEELVKILLDFDWSDYGLDLMNEVDPTWAGGLAHEIVMKWRRLT